MWHCLHDPMFSCFDTKPACNRQMGSNITTSLTIDYLPLWPFAMKSGMMIAVQPGPLCRCTLAFVCAPLDGPPRNVEFELQSNFVWECLHLNSDMIHRLRWDLILACHIWPRFMKRWVWEPLESKCGQIWGVYPTWWQCILIKVTFGAVEHILYPVSHVRYNHDQRRRSVQEPHRFKSWSNVYSDWGCDEAS